MISHNYLPLLIVCLRNKKNLLVILSGENTDMETTFSESTCPELNIDFTIEEVMKIVNHPKSGKVPGIDGLLNGCFKNHNSIKVLTVLFNACLRCHV